MKKIRLSKPTFYLSGLLLAVLLGSGLFFRSVLLPFKTVEIKKTQILGQSITLSPSLSPSPLPSLKPSVKPSVKVSTKPSPKPSPSPAPPGSANPEPPASPVVLGTTSSAPSPNSSPNPSPPPAGGSSPNPSPSASISTQTVNLEIQGSSFTVEISGDLNVCQVLEKAKEQGKISSLTLDDSYKSSLNSLYVREINGLSNNWTFKVNGNSPLGCSLYTVKPGDQVVFKYG